MTSSNSTLHGLSLIGGQSATPFGKTFSATNPANGETLSPLFYEAQQEEVERACQLAALASLTYGRSTGVERAAFLRAIAEQVEALGEALLDRFTEECGLPRGRADGERARTCGQLRLFATLVETDQWADPRIDLAQPDRKPLAKPDTRSLLRPVGPVAVFGPANFPLAFSVAGGDTASALAAGCPVIVKAHSSHPGVSELMGLAIQRAAAQCALPAGVFSLLFGSGRTIGTALVTNPAIWAVGFTGSKKVGRHLFDLCNARPAPIPFFGELASINPVCILPSALKADPEKLADGFHASLTLGCGQFCTNPGLVLYVKGAPGAEKFIEHTVALCQSTPPVPMLNFGTRASYLEGVKRLADTTGVLKLVSANEDTRTTHSSPALFQCNVQTFRANPHLHDEVFGPCALLIGCENMADMTDAVTLLEGQLTATVHGSDAEIADVRNLVSLLEQRAGRLTFNGWPTGVEVCASMVHSGPWPATTDGRFTSVGTGAILRWVRPICWQNAPLSLLPAALKA